jgi:hypothetical protein
MKEWIIIIILLIIGAFASYALLIIQPHGADIQTDVLTIHVSERFPGIYRSDPYVITDTNVAYTIGFGVNFLDLQPGYNYTIEKQQFVEPTLRNKNTNGTITKIISKVL